MIFFNAGWFGLGPITQTRDLLNARLRKLVEAEVEDESEVPDGMAKVVETTTAEPRIYQSVRLDIFFSFLPKKTWKHAISVLHACWVNYSLAKQNLCNSAAASKNSFLHYKYSLKIFANG